jgi:hypothetical protein
VLWTNGLKSRSRTPARHRNPYIPPSRTNGSSVPRKTSRSNPESTPVTRSL